MSGAIAIIPARGGSKGIPRKNARLLCGLPLVTYTIRAAIESRVFESVVLTTDDALIADIGRMEGCAVVIRPDRLAQDATSTEPVMEHALAEVESDGRAPFDSVWLLQPTSPLRGADDIRAAAMILDTGFDAVVSVTDEHVFHWAPDDSGGITPLYDLALRPRRQDMQPNYRENGAVYAVRRGVWDETRLRAAGRVAPLVLPANQSVEIDDEADWRLVEATLNAESSRISSIADCLPDCVQGIVFDFDGVFTDNTVTVSESGAESVVCSRSDGWGVAEMARLGIPMVVISTESNPVVAMRCRKLGIECVQGAVDKTEALLLWLARTGVEPSASVFMGNDVNDLGCFGLVGSIVVPADAHPLVRARANAITRANGGRGAIRELTDAILQKVGDSRA